MDIIKRMTPEQKEAYRILKREYAIKYIQEHRPITEDEAIKYIDEHHHDCWTTRECPWMPWPEASGKIKQTCK